MSDDLKLLTVYDVQTQTGLPLSSIYKLIETGNLPHYKIGRRIFIRRSTLTRWMEEQEHAHGKALQARK